MASEIKEVVGIRKIYKFTCDMCSKPASNHRVCRGCQKDLCTNCIVYSYRDPFTGEDTGDWPIYACKECNVKLEPYAQTAKRLLDEYDEAVARLRVEWEGSCRI